MEVASPLPYQPAGSKRSFACSPTMDMSDDYNMVAASKRRRFDHSISPTTGFASHFHNSTNLNRNIAIQQGPTKRSRTENGYAEGINTLVETQAREIQSLKSDNAKLRGEVTQLKGQHDKVVHESKLLKRLVTHQHERQTQAHSQLEAANKYKTEAEDRMSKMEQMILQLRYHLQTTQQHSNDFMGGMRPPDVY